jgi:hypothetical protein
LALATGAGRGAGAVRGDRAGAKSAWRGAAGRALVAGAALAVVAGLAAGARLVAGAAFNGAPAGARFAAAVLPAGLAATGFFTGFGGAIFAATFFDAAAFAGLTVLAAAFFAGFALFALATIFPYPVSAFAGHALSAPGWLPAP